jgi:protein ImuB
LARVQALVGPDQVLVAQPRGGRDPGDRVAWRRWGEPIEADPSPAAPWPGATPSPSPALIPRQPTQIDVEWDDGMPARVRLRSRWVPVVSWAGPWRKTGRWWKDELDADRYQIVTSVGAFLCEVKANRTFLIGVYD